MKTTIVIYGSSTGSCQSIAETIASKLGVEAVDELTSMTLLSQVMRIFFSVLLHGVPARCRMTGMMA